MIWQLPERAQIGGCSYGLNTDFRVALRIIGFLNGELPEFIRWQVALRLFYQEPIPPQQEQAAMAYLAWFLGGGEDAPAKAGPKRMDWEVDAAAIVADINRVAGQEIRSLSHLHWWTFLSWFHGIGEGQLSFLVGIREKRHRGEKLTAAEEDFYRRNRDRVDMKKACSAEEQAEKERLLKLLAGS